MPVKMAPHQLAFWRALLSPFPDHLLSTKPAKGNPGKELTWVDKRAIANRLDSLCGPCGWKPEYMTTERGFKCRLHLLVPTFSESEPWVWTWKEDGAGHEGMQTEDDDEKSGYTNAFRRAAQDAWGIGRYLYRKGIPSFLDPNARPVEETYGQEAVDPKQQGRPEPKVREDAAATASEKPKKPAGTSGSGSTSRTQSTDQGNFIVPTMAKQVWGWAKENGKTFEVDVVKILQDHGEQIGIGRILGKWQDQSVREACLHAIRRIRELPTYSGQYEQVFADGAVAVQAPEPAQAPTGGGVNLATLRREVVAKSEALLRKQLGREPSVQEKRAAFENVAAASVNGAGHTGEVPDSLKDCSDVVWLKNMLATLQTQIAEAVALPEDEQVPF